MSAPRRVLPADVYDALELSALAYGGIGAGRFGEDPDLGAYGTYVRDGSTPPYCVWGMQRFLEGSEDDGVALALDAALIDIRANDDGVRAINRRLLRSRDDRVPFDLWCAELGVERGA